MLSTDDTGVYEPDKRLLSAVCSPRDAAAITSLIHDDCMRRVGAAVAATRQSAASGSPAICWTSAIGISR